MAAPEQIVIVGASLAGAKAAEALREEGYDGRVVLIGAEAELPYERPPLSKYYLRGESDREKARVHDAAFYAEKDIDLRTGTAVEAIDVAGRCVTLAGGESVAWDRLLLTTGAEPRRVPIPGADLEGVLSLRTLDDSDRLRAAIQGGGRLAVIGAGWIGAEAAASARQLGAEVTLIERLDVPLETVLGPTVGKIYADAHREQGVELLTGAAVEAIEGDGKVEGVRLAGGRVVDCTAVLVGVGVAPRTALAEAAGLAVDNGILVDANLQTSAPDVYAAGDVANHDHPFYGRRVRVEHWANALNQGPAAARNMLGAGQAYERLPYFYSDQYDVGMEYSGLAKGDDQVVIRGDEATRELIAFWLEDGRVVAGMNMNVWDVTGPIQALIRSRKTVDPARLADPSVPLEELA
ncbi:MAG: 3-phenylpropionate/trans-cinnamate dioxygenase ferredoxin reductase component [Miltoncostaeaceae bacterium]|nr:3-phenylpropionate/trans-cinnamate dioxygenase ferredoxin reductase component [Miltoncostaeaceae bacterium]